MVEGRSDPTRNEEARQIPRAVWYEEKLLGFKEEGGPGGNSLPHREKFVQQRALKVDMLDIRQRSELSWLRSVCTLLLAVSTNPFQITLPSLVCRTVLIVSK